MSPHRTQQDPFHLREARRPAHVSDAHADKTTRAYEAVVRGDYKGARSRESGAGASNREYVERAEPDPRDSPPPPPALVLAALERSRVIPRVLTVPCGAHDAAVGEPCYRAAVGVCAERITRRAAKP